MVKPPKQICINHYIYLLIYKLIDRIGSDLVLSLSTGQEVPAGKWNIVDLYLRHHQVILSFHGHLGLRNTHNLMSERQGGKREGGMDR